MSQAKTNRDEVDRLIAEFFKSNLSQNEFCRQKNINVGTFRWWLKRERDHASKKTEKNDAPFIKVVPTISSVKSSDKESELVIEFESGTRIKWKGIEIPQKLQQLVTTIINGVE